MYITIEDIFNLVNSEYKDDNPMESKESNYRTTCFLKGYASNPDDNKTYSALANIIQEERKTAFCVGFKTAFTFFINL